MARIVVRRDTPRSGWPKHNPHKGGERPSCRVVPSICRFPLETGAARRAERFRRGTDQARVVGGTRVDTGLEGSGREEGFWKVWQGPWPRQAVSTGDREGEGAVRGSRRGAGCPVQRAAGREAFWKQSVYGARLTAADGCEQSSSAERHDVASSRLSGGARSGCKGRFAATARVGHGSIVAWGSAWSMGFDDDDDTWTILRVSLSCCRIARCCCCCCCCCLLPPARPPARSLLVVVKCAADQGWMALEDAWRRRRRRLAKFVCCRLGRACTGEMADCRPSRRISWTSSRAGGRWAGGRGGRGRTGAAQARRAPIHVLRRGSSSSKEHVCRSVSALLCVALPCGHDASYRAFFSAACSVPCESDLPHINTALHSPPPQPVR